MIGSFKNGVLGLVWCVIASACGHKQAAPPDNNQLLSVIDSTIFQLVATSNQSTIPGLINQRNDLQKTINIKHYCEWNFRLYDTLEKYDAQSLYPENADEVYRSAMMLGDTGLEKKANDFLYKAGISYYRDSKYLPARALLELYMSAKPSQQTLAKPLPIYITGTLAEIYLRLGDDKKSLLLWTEVYNYFAALPVNKRNVNTYVGISNASNEIGNYEKAAFYANQGLLLPDSPPKYVGYLKAVLAESSFGLKKYEAAELKAAETISLIQNNADVTDDDRSKFLHTYADALQGNGKCAQALVHYKMAAAYRFAATRSDKTRESSKIYKSLGDCFYLLKQKDSAIFYYHKALGSVVKIDSSDVLSLPEQQNLYAENAIQEALDAMANWWIEKQDVASKQQALQALRLAMKVDELLQQQFSFDVSKLGYQRQKKSRSEKAIQICLQLYNQDKKPEWIRKAWNFSEAAKAALLRDDIRQQVVYRQNANDTLIQQINWNQQERAQIKRALFETPNDSLKATLNKRMEVLDNKYAILTMSSNLNNPAIEKLLTVDEDIDFLSHPMFANMPAIEFFAADSGKYYIFSKAIDGTLNLHSFVLQDSLLTKWLAFFTQAENCNNEPVQFKKMANDLYQQLLQPILQNQTSASLLIIPDGKLWYLPWDALVTDTQFHSSWSQTAFLVKSAATTLGFSLENLIQQNGRKQNATQDAVGAFAPATFSKERQLQPLASSLKEIAGIKDAQPKGKFFTNNAATVSNFKKMVGLVDVLHVSTHASGGETEDQCKLQLYDSAIYLHELYPLQVNATTVVLSACETGLGKFENGEGVFSMSRGFYFAGAKNVITSLWKVDDESTADLFKLFYEQKDAPFQMLHKAKNLYLEQHRGSNASPYYWAAFVNTGYTQSKTSNKNIGWWLVGLGLVGGLVYMVKRKKKS